MKVLCSTLSEMKNNIVKKNKKVVFFGAGVLGQITAPFIFEQLNLLEYISCYIDNDCSKWGHYIKVLGMSIPVYSPEELKNYDSNTVIILNVSRFSEVLRQLEQMECTKNMDCFIMGMMCIHNFCNSISEGEAVFEKEQLIPKKIHYMWLGGKKLPDNLKKCIESWRKFCPDYEIIEWNEDNYDIDKHPYMREAYDAGAYGFVPDFARLDLLYEQGGIYMDTDVELKRGLDPLLYQEAFCGVEKWQVINFGGCSGAVKGSKALKRFLDARRKIYFLDENGKQNKTTCGFYDTKTAVELGYTLNGKTQHLEGINVFASDFFHPYDYMSANLALTEHTYSVHWFNGGWLDDKSREINQRTADEYNVIYNLCVRGM